MDKSRGNSRFLIPGAGKGPPPGEGGRPPNWIRQQLRGNFAERMAFLNSVIDGDPMVRVRWDLRDVLPHCVCANCGESQLVAADKEREVEVEVMTSASVKDRITAIDLQAKYGLGTSNEERVTDARDLPTAEEARDRILTLLKA